MVADIAGSWGELVRRIGAQYNFNDLTDAQVDIILWERTAWPMSGLDHTQKQLHDYFRTTKEGTVAARTQSLEIHDTVDDVPEKRGRRQSSRWDPVIDKAVAEAGKWVPVTRPPSFSNQNVNWLKERKPGLEVEVRAELVYLSYQPNGAAPAAEAETTP